MTKMGIRTQALAVRPASCCVPIAGPDVGPGEAEAAAGLFRALADPNRVRLVNMLANAGDAVCVCDLTERIGLSQGTVSFHLKKLFGSGLIDREQRGTWAYYSLNRAALASVADVFVEGVSR